MQTLADAHPAAAFALRAQYRMADDLAKISNVISYRGRMRAANDAVATRVMRSLLVNPETDVLRAFASSPAGLDPRDSPWLVAASDPARRVVFLDTSDCGARAFETSGEETVREGKAGPRAGASTSTRTSAGSSAAPARRAARGARRRGCAVLSPYNSQVDALASDLRRREAATPQTEPPSPRASRP